jgi:hypothetical protein
MRTVRILVAVVIALVGAIETGIALGDRDLFVSSPEAVVEGFVRHVATGRYDRARAMLAHKRASRSGLEEIKTMARELERRVGAAETIEGETIRKDREEAIARARIRGSRAEAAIVFSLRWDQGRWKIGAWHRSMTWSSERRS